MNTWTVEKLVAFERAVSDLFQSKKIRGPVHLSGGNEELLLKVFEEIGRDDWVFSTYRSHYHALLHGIDQRWLLNRIMDGRSMNLFHREPFLYTSAIVGGCLPIAVGAAAAFKRKNDHRKVWCFVGDMAATTGAFHEAQAYAVGHDLPITFVVEDNGLSVQTPTEQTWGGRRMMRNAAKTIRYAYHLTWPHVGTGRFVTF